MAFRLAKAGEQRTQTFVKRFDPRFWTVNFPRPMMAAVTTTGATSLAVDAVFYKADDLAGLIWEAEDRFDHPLLAYETDRDFRGLTLAFRWRSSGVLALDGINGPTLTIEGRDAEGNPRSWYVRLWNYASGTPDDAAILLDFDAMDGGFLLPGEADRVWAGDIDRLFVSLVAPGYTGADGALESPQEAQVTLSDIVCEGARSVLAIGDAFVPGHRLRIATGYDDSYNLTPARVLRTILQLGYRGTINHYVGMSHYFRLEANSGGFYASLAGGVLNVACAAWHASFAAEAKALGFELILSLSYELLDQHCWGDWKQRAEDGAPALTGWVPPSTLLSPANAGAMSYLRQVAQAFAGIAAAAGLRVRFQIGEPWWWVTGDGRPCLYDDAARAAFGGAPVSIASVRGALDAGRKALLDQAGALLAASTAALCAAVRAVAADAELLLLAYLPSVLDPAAPEVRRANLPMGWARPAFDVLQLEDYDWVTGDDAGATAAGTREAALRLGYPLGETHYFSGFVLNAGDAGAQWPLIERAAMAGQARGHAETFVWALPQVARDGFLHFELGDESMQAFDDVDFPIAIGAHASVEPGFSTAIVASASGVEQRNMDWAQARLRFDAGPGVRSQADIEALLRFFRARRGAARGFRFRDPLDDSSAGSTDAAGFGDVPLGIGDGARTRFALVKLYGDDAPELRRITRPIAGSVRVGVGGSERLTGWALEEGGIVSFASAPAAGQAVTAGYRFAVPVRFAEDHLQVSLGAVLAGEAPSVPLIEVREMFA
ncbi:DUF2460 domain-containing protein [Sphingomonas bacterium]|uniref:DUF2460 domain-containing protein n=1 Tax=Sphingomonas bacterium TaxID=1895847 RepID=UPI0015772578|nr:DUF2460 domain-containing protein [Sphingomonas bacterium]